MTSTVRLAWLAFAALLALALGAGEVRAQKGKKDDVCPYCGGDPERMKKAGLVSHGPFEFGASDVAHAEVLVAGTDVKWIESEHCRIGFGIVGNYKVKDEEKKIDEAFKKKSDEVLAI